MLVTGMIDRPPIRDQAAQGAQPLRDIGISGELELELQALRPVIRAVVARVLGEHMAHPDAEDGTHEALRRALEGRHRLQPGRPIRPWVLGIARHVALDMVRQRQRATPAGSSPVLEQVPDSAPGADDQLDRTERLDRVRNAMEQLDAGPRQALLMFHLEGLGYREIGARLGVPLGTVCTWVARGRQRVAASLLADESDEREGS